MRAKRVYVLPILLLYVIGLVSCKDWGEVDPPAGNQQIDDAKETVAEFTFETLDMFAMELGTYEGGAKPELVRDEKFQSNVLHLNGGYIGMDNPLIGKTIENGVSVSLWTKMSAGTITRNGGQEEQNETSEVPADSNGALLSFTNDSESFVIMQDGSVLFRNESIMTGVQGLSDGEWHYWTLSIGGGYISLYADGSKKAESELSADAYGSLSVFLTAGASNMYIGYGSTTRPSEMWVEDLKFVNGVISEDEVEVPATGIIVVGATDFSTGFGGAYSQVWTVENNTVFKCRFKNYSNMEQNWFNYILGISNGLKPGDEGYKNYAYIRADNYGWIDDKNDNTHLAASSCTYNWETLRDDLNGATVDLKFTRRGNSGLVETVIITADGRKLTMNSAVRNLSADANVGVFFTVDHSYLEIEGASISREPLKWQEGQVGNSDNSSLKNSHITDVLTLVPESEAVIKFKNYTSGLAAADNWMLALSNGKAPGQVEYSEYALLRADNWGWLNGNDQETLDKNECVPSNNYLIGEEWSDFRQYMNGADVTIIVRRIKNNVSVKADITTEAGAEYNYFWKYSGLPQSGNVGLFLTVNNSYLQVSKNEAKEKSEGTVDNRLGDTGFMTGWWQAFTPVQKLDGNGTVTYTFVNHSNRIATWNNWALGVSNGNAVGETGYSEYVVLRADNYGWVKGEGKHLNFETTYDNALVSHLIDGANVILTIERKGVDLNINAEYTKDGQSYTYKGTLENVVPETGEIGTFLTVDGAYLTDIDVEVTESYQPDYVVIGSENFDTEFNAVHSDIVSLIGDGSSVYYEFVNYSTENGASYNNWNLCLTNGKKPGESNYVEYYFMRADNYGWAWGVSGHKLNFETDLPDYTTTLRGATVKMTITRNGKDITIDAKILKGGNEYYYRGTIKDIIPPCANEVGTYLTVDKSYLMIDKNATRTVSGTSAPVSVSGQVGASDFTTGFDVAKTESLIATVGQSFKYTFWNYNDRQSQSNGDPWPYWYNWVFVLKDANNTVAYIRADWAAWGSLVNNNFTANTYDMNFLTGAKVDLTVELKTDGVYLYADYSKDVQTLATEGQTHSYEAKISNITLSGDTDYYGYLTLEHSYIVLESSSVQ